MGLFSFSLTKMADLKYPVSYLEVHDFDRAGNLVAEKLIRKPVMVMLQAGWCGHCIASKPEFQKFADMGIIKCATIQEDGSRNTEKDLGKLISFIYPEKFIGYPSYMLFLPSGKKLAYNGGRDAESLKHFVSSQIGNYN